MEKIVSKYPVLQYFQNPQVLFGLMCYGILIGVLTVFIGNFWAALSFWLAAYAVIGNDAVQTLMTYIHSNRDIPWKVLYAGVATVLLAVLWYGFLTAGDISYGRLDAKGYANIEIEWYVAIFPLILVFLTRFRGIPVSTSLLMLSIFSGTLLFQQIVLKSAAGYLVAFFAAFLMWIIVEFSLKKLSATKNKLWSLTSLAIGSGIASLAAIVWMKYALIPYLQNLYPQIGEISSMQFLIYGIVLFLFMFGIFYDAKWDDSISRKSVFWRIAQTFTTILLFSTWLMHDMVNIAVFLPTGFWLDVMLLISALFLLGLAYTFYINGWPVGNIVTRKTSTNEIIAATMIDLVYFVILLIFKDWSNIPMSTTWVFVGLLAGRQFAIRAINRIDTVEWSGRMNLAFKESWKDFSKIMVGLGISVVALILVRYMTGT